MRVLVGLRGPGTHSCKPRQAGLGVGWSPGTSAPRLLLLDGSDKVDVGRNALAKVSRHVTIGFVLAMSLIAEAGAQAIGGSYALAGKNFDGSNYTGVVQITPEGSTCRIAWQTGGSRSEGLCMLSGKTLAAFYRLGSDYGMVIYELQPDGSLRGRWSVAGKQGVGSELLVPRK